jgi:hypothetical protein
MRVGKISDHLVETKPVNATIQACLILRVATVKNLQLGQQVPVLLLNIPDNCCLSNPLCYNKTILAYIVVIPFSP